MSYLPFHQQQLEFMTKLVNSRIELLNPFFRFLNYFDSLYFFLVLIPILWLGVSYKWGIRIFYWLTFNTLAINFAKNWVGWPRPSTDLPELGMFHPKSNGFPSGGALISMFLGTLFIYYCRTRTAWIIGTLYILLISFSRLYLGVHYPIDILGGWAFAWVLSALFIHLNPKIERFLKKKGLRVSLLLSLAIPFAIMLAAPYSSVYFVMGITIGVGIGIHLSLNYGLFLPSPKSLQQSLVRSLIGIITLSSLYFLLPSPTFLNSFLIGLFMSSLASPICKWCIHK